jgi:hypothetical protein
MAPASRCGVALSCGRHCFAQARSHHSASSRLALHFKNGNPFLSYCPNSGLFHRIDLAEYLTICAFETASVIPNSFTTLLTHGLKRKDYNNVYLYYKNFTFLTISIGRMELPFSERNFGIDIYLQ